MSGAAGDRDAIGRLVRDRDDEAEEVAIDAEVGARARGVELAVDRVPAGDDAVVRGVELLDERELVTDGLLDALPDLVERTLVSGRLFF